MLWHKIALTALSLCGSAASQTTSETAQGPQETATLPRVLTVTTTLNSFVATSSSAQAEEATATPSPTAALNDTVPYAPLPPTQDWCAEGGNATYCPGPLLQLVQLAEIFSDSKTFSDKPTKQSVEETSAAFDALSANATYEEVVEFVEQNFQGEGQELIPVEIQGFNPTPALLDQIDDQFYKGFASLVNGYWSLLIRETNQTALCNGENCDSSIIPFNNTIVVPGGRYREIYYWDSFWILEGLLRSELYDYARDLVTNFMDLLDLYGFLPNGGRKYYLNRSQPPVFTLMVNAYVQTTGNATILERALPLLETELEFWRTNRTISVESPFTGKNHTVARFDVSINTAPRPEGYIEDYETVFGGSETLNESQRSDLYAELATGAESGWDYSSRWCKEPLLNKTDNLPALRTLNGRAIVPVDLNAVLYGDHVILADLYELHQQSGSSDGNNSSEYGDKIDSHRKTAEALKEAILDLMWDPEKTYFYDYNTTGNERSPVYHAGGLWPLWHNITPSEIASNETAAMELFAGVRFVADRYPGPPSVSTLLDTGLNWDFPNAWPPHTYTGIKALEAIGRVFPNGTTVDSILLSDFSSIPQNQLGIEEDQLPVQPQDVIGPNAKDFAARVKDIQAGKPWWQALAIEYANRYMQSTFCSWYSTGGGIPGLLEPLSPEALNATGAQSTDQGHMFEKFNSTDVDAAGGGGEYEVVIGFGWTNGVVLWTAGEYGQYLATPDCPLISIVSKDNETEAGQMPEALSNGRKFTGHRLTPGSLKR